MAIGVALLVVLNTVVRESGVGAAGIEFVGAPSLPVVQMARPSAWRCPGPLPIGAGKESSRIAIVNGSNASVSLSVAISRTGIPARGVSGASSVSTSRLEVAGDSQTVLTLPRHGPAGLAAVSIETDAGGIGVAESIRGASSAAGGVIFASPCTLGSSPRSYVPSGSTLGASDVLVSLYDPDATPAVVNLSVSNGVTLSSPPAFQGLVVPASGLVVLDLRRWVFQLSSLAITATSVSGDVVLGALETTSATVAVASATSSTRQITHAVLSGASLLVGSDQGLGQWAFTALQSRIGVESMFSTYNPGTRPVSVSVAPPGRTGKVAALTEDVPAGGIVEFATPIAPGTPAGARSVVVSSQGGVVVVARLTTRQRTTALEELNATSGTAGPSDRWLLPGAVVTANISDVLTVDNPGTRSAAVTLLELIGGSAGAVWRGAYTVLPGTQRSINLRPILNHAPEVGLELSATVPILVEQQLTPGHGQTTDVGAIPMLP
ncbi:MAG: hypothetical protein ABSD97_07210 [Acidimicrobiales bacterium]